MTSSQNPPDDIPAEVTAVLRDSNDSQLRDIIEYAQQLLRARPPLTDTIEPRAGEEVVRMEDHGAYTLVVVEHPAETGDARGPFAYMVRWEPGADTENGKYRWHYLGKVYDDAGGD